jgi:hypothetical protein
MPRKRNVPALREPDPFPWEKQKGESSKAFEAFRQYRDLGITRSLRRVEEILAEDRTAGPGPSMVRDWSSRWQWVARADAWDREEDRRRRADRDRALADAARTQAMAGTIMLGAALRRMRGDPSNPDAPVLPLDLNDLDANDVARLAEVGAKLQRAGLGDTPLDLKGGLLIRAEDAQRLARDLVSLALDSLTGIAWATAEALGANGQAAEIVPAVVARFQDAHLEQAEAVFRKAVSR